MILGLTQLERWTSSAPGDMRRPSRYCEPQFWWMKFTDTLPSVMVRGTTRVDSRLAPVLPHDVGGETRWTGIFGESRDGRHERLGVRRSPSCRKLPVIAASRPSTIRTVANESECGRGPQSDVMTSIRTLTPPRELEHGAGRPWGDRRVHSPELRSCSSLPRPSTSSAHRADSQGATCEEKSVLVRLYAQGGSEVAASLAAFVASGGIW
jgi:hypothetical protein